MTSILTNMSAMSAVQNLTATQSALAKTQNQISTGQRVASAQDNASYWSIATLMRSDIGALGAVQDSINLTKAIAQVTAAAVGTVLTDMQGIAQDLVTAQSAGINLDTIQQDIAQKQAGILQAARSATFNGVNWLVGSRTANISIKEHHVLDETYATIEAEQASNVQPDDPVPTNPPIVETVQGVTYYQIVPSTQPQPKYDYTDRVTYTATADETDTVGNHLSQSLAFQGTDQDEAYTSMEWRGGPGAAAGDPPVWSKYYPPHRDRVNPEAASSSNLTNTGSVDFRSVETDHVPISIANGAVPTLDVDTNLFRLFTDYTGTTSVTEDTTDAAGSPPTAGNFTSLYPIHSYTKSQAYSSYDSDNGFDVDPGALDTAVGVPNGANSLSTVPEDDFGAATKTSVLNFDLRNPGTGPAAMLQVVQTDLASLRAMSSRLGSLQSSLVDQSTFVSSLTDTLTAGVGALVDADMNQASTRLAALQTQQQLGIQSLSIANTQSQLILKLFQ